eukprot:1588-Heterococcus_DN1.PRE.10
MGGGEGVYALQYMCTRKPDKDLYILRVIHLAFFATSRSYVLVGNIEHFGACALAKRLACVSSAEHVVCKRTRQCTLA